ncbi:hypothetical protein [Thiogranum longum]
MKRSRKSVVNQFRKLRRGDTAQMLAWALAASLSLWSLHSRAQEEAPALQRLVENIARPTQLIMLQAVCDQGKARIRDGVAYCEICPSYTSQAGDKSGFSISGITLGSFTKEREQEAWLNMQGCESEAGQGGGMVLLQQTASGWSRLNYQKNYRLRECLKFRTKNGTQSLLCNQSVITPSDERGEILWVNMSGKEFKAETLLRWYDNLKGNPRQLVSVFPYRFFRSDFNQDGRSDVRIMFRIREEAIPEKYAGAIDALGAGYKSASPKTLGLIYLFDGSALELDRSSLEASREIDQILARYLPKKAP